LNLNQKGNKFGDNSLLKAIRKNNTDIVQLLIDYANKNNIILELNEKNKEGDYPLLLAIIKNNVDIVQLLID